MMDCSSFTTTLMGLTSFSPAMLCSLCGGPIGLPSAGPDFLTVDRLVSRKMIFGDSFSILERMES